jgi:hypothetical protein
MKQDGRVTGTIRRELARARLRRALALRHGGVCRGPGWYRILRWAQRDRPVRCATFLFLALAPLLVLLAWARPIDHDESQYVAAVALMAGHLPFRDFVYLQTPLQPLLFAPLATMASGWLYPALRMLNALIGAGAIALLFHAARRAGATPGAALAGALLLAACDAFLFGAAVARNDMLPLLLEVAALLLLATGKGGNARSAAIGLALGAAAAAKLSYAIPLGAMLAFTLFDPRPRREALRPAAMLAGAAVAGLPVLILAALAPRNFLFGIYIFPAQAPGEWYRAAGMAWKLGLPMKLVDSIKFLALGPALFALLIVGRRRCAQGWHSALLPLQLDLLTIAGLVAALLPEPTWRQYLLPALPPLFLRLALLLDARPGRRVQAALFVSALAGLVPSGAALATAAWHDELPLLTATREAHAMGTMLRAHRVTGPVAGLSPQLWVDSGARLDPRFATGPFLFRSALLDPAAERALHTVSRSRLSQALDARPPAAIIVGGENERMAGSGALDAAVTSDALAAGYRPFAAPRGPLILLLPATPRGLPSGSRTPIMPPLDRYAGMEPNGGKWHRSGLHGQSPDAATLPARADP